EDRILAELRDEIAKAVARAMAEMPEPDAGPSGHSCPLAFREGASGGGFLGVYLEAADRNGRFDTTGTRHLADFVVNLNQPGSLEGTIAGAMAAIAAAY